MSLVAFRVEDRRSETTPFIKISQMKIQKSTTATEINYPLATDSRWKKSGVKWDDLIVERAGDIDFLYVDLSTKSSLTPLHIPSTIEFLAKGHGVTSPETGEESLPTKLKYLLEQISSKESRGEHRSAAKEVLDFIERNFASKNMSANNELLDAIADGEASLSPWPLVALIRSTSRKRDELPAWRKAVLTARATLAKKGSDPDRLLAGVIVGD